MKILLINNHTQHLASLEKSLAGHDLEIQVYRPGLDFHVAGKDLVILSGGGGEGLEINDVYKRGKLWYEDQMKFVKDTQLPVIGICMGFEVICRLFGSEVTPTGKLIQGFKKLTTTKSGTHYSSHSSLTQFESHNWRVQQVDTSKFEVLAQSAIGLEMIKHRRRPLLATQFHPEIEGGTLKLAEMLNG